MVCLLHDDDRYKCTAEYSEIETIAKATAASIQISFCESMCCVCAT